METNKKYADNQEFINACAIHEVKPTARQASKFRRGLGLLIIKTSGVDVVKTSQKLDPLFQVKGIERFRKIHSI